MTAKIYKVTTFLKSNTHPMKWFNDTLSECLEENEDILNTIVDEVGQSEPVD